MKIAILPGDGIGHESMVEALRVLDLLRADGLKFETEKASVGGTAFDETGVPLPDATLKLCQQSDAVLFGAVGGTQYDSLPREKRPEQAILGLRKNLALFANLRPALLYPELANASSLKPEIVAGLDLMIIRELTGDIYFGEPRGIHKDQNGERVGVNTMTYRESEIRRIAHVGFQTALKRGKRLCSVDKMNVLETTQLWRDVVIEVATEYPQVELSHILVDNCAMQLVRNPKQFDTLVTGNLFGDILSDEASMLTGSIGMLPSASLDANNKGLYEPIHGSAPDIAGKGVANPLAMMLSAAMMLRYTFSKADEANRIENAVRKVLSQGHRTGDIFEPGTKKVGTKEMGDAVVAALRQ